MDIDGVPVRRLVGDVRHVGTVAPQVAPELGGVALPGKPPVPIAMWESPGRWSHWS